MMTRKRRPLLVVGRLRLRQAGEVLRKIDVRRPVHAVLIGIIVAGIVTPVAAALAANERYRLMDAERGVIEKPAPTLASKLQYDKAKHAHVFNPDGTAPKDPLSETAIASQAGGKKQQLYSATMPDDPSQGVMVQDNVNNVTIGFTPTMALMGGRAVDGHVIYPLKDQPGHMVFTPKANGVKEDIYLSEAPEEDRAIFTYKLTIPKYVEARLDEDGSIGFYTAGQELFGNITYGTDQDRGLVDRARQNNTKNYLMFKIPAPTVKQTGKAADIMARFVLDNGELSVHVQGLKKASYPLSIDPTFLLASTSDFVLGSVDDNIDLTQPNQVGRATLSGGSVSGWTVDTNSLANGNYAAGLVAYNNALYMIGGGNDDAVATNVTTNKVMYVLLNANGTQNGTWQTSGNTLVAARQGLIAFGFNGYLYAVGGQNTSAVALSSVEYSKIGTNGAPGAWTTSPNALTTARGYLAGAIYQGVIYAIGGTSGTMNAGFLTSSEYSRIGGDGVPGAWSTTGMPTLATGRTRFQGGAYNGYVYVAGGMTGTASTPSGVTNTVLYAPINANGTLGSWNTTGATPFPTARRDHGFAVINGHIYVYAGCSSVTLPCATVNLQPDTEYAVINADGSVGQWQRTEDYNYQSGAAPFGPRVNPASAFYNGFLHFVGGCNVEASAANNHCTSGGLRVGTFLTGFDDPGRFDKGIQGGVQTTTPYDDNNPGSARAGGQTAVLNGYLYYVSGCSSASCSHYDSAVNYAQIGADGSLGTWNTTTSLPAGRLGHSVAAYNNKLYVAGGTERSTSASFPAATSVTGSVVAATSTTHNFSMPATVAAGDLLLAIINYTGGSGTTANTPTGWTQMTTVNNGTTTRTAVFAKSAAGTEGGTTVNFTTTGSAVGAAQVYRILANNWLGGTPSTANIAVANAAATGTTAPNPPSLTPTWGADDTLWITCACGNTFTGTPTVPAGYATQGNSVTGTGTTGSNVATATLATNAASQDPGTWTTVSATGEALTIAVAPPGDSATTFDTAVISSTQASNGTLGAWGSETSLPAAKAFASVAVWHNFIFVAGGLSNATTVTTTIYKASITNGTMSSWAATTTPLSHARWGHSGGIWGNWLYVIGGQSDTSGTYVTAANSAEQLVITDAGDIIATSSTQNPTGSFLRRTMGGFVENGVMYAYGGITSGSTNAVTAISYSQLNATTGALGAWQTDAGNAITCTTTCPASGTFGLSTARSLTSAVAGSGTVYVMGGCTTALATTDFRGCTGFVSNAFTTEEFLRNNGGSGQVNTFAAATSLPNAGSPAATGRADHSTVAYNGFLYIVGGCTSYTTGNCTNGSNMTDVQKAPINQDGSLGSWTATGVTALPSGGSSLGGAVAYNGKMYVVAGRTNTANVATTSVYYATISSTGDIGAWTNSSGNYLPAARSSFGIAIARGYIYVAGGKDATPTRQSTVYYTKIDNTDGTLSQPTVGCTGANVWCTTTALNSARSDLNLVSYNGNLYAAGGTDGTNNLTDIIMGPTSATDGSISGWSFTTDVARGSTFRQVVAANGYMYFIGNEGSNTQITYVDINSNGTLGLIQHSVAGVAGTHAHGAAAYLNGFFYVNGGCTVASNVCTTVLTSGTSEYAGQLAISRVGHYSKLFNTQVNTAPSQLVIDGSLSGPGSQVAVQFFTATAAGAFGVAQLFQPMIFGSFYNVQALDGSGNNIGVATNYLIVITLDDSNSGTFPDVTSTTETNVNSVTLYYHANPTRRLRHGAAFTTTDCNPTPANGCILDTAP